MAIRGALPEGELLVCSIEMRAADRISIVEASRRLQNVRRIFEGLLIRQGTTQAALSEPLRAIEARGSEMAALHDFDVELEERSRAARPPDLSVADEVWANARRHARIAINDIPVESIRYGSPYEIVLAIRDVAQPANVAILATSVIALKIPQIINAFSRIPADREKAKLDRETYAAQRAELRRLVPVENAEFIGLPTRRAELQVAERLQSDEKSILNGLAKVERVVTVTREKISQTGESEGVVDVEENRD